MANTPKRLKIFIAVIALLIVFSIAVLGDSSAFGQTEIRGGSVSTCCAASIAVLSKTVTAIDSAQDTVIAIYKTHAEDAAPFRLTNMFPGDSQTKGYLVEVSHKGTVTVRFRANIREGYEKLAEVLKCRVELRDEKHPLYDGLMSDMPESINKRISSTFGTTTELTYDITVYLDTSVGNDYMNRELVADFCWWVLEEDSDTTSLPETETTAAEDSTGPHDTTASDETTDVDDTTASDETTDADDSTAPDDTTEHGDTTGTDDTDGTTPDDGELIYPPQTGDRAHFCIWYWIAMISLLVNIILLLPKQRKKSDKRDGSTSNEE